MTKPVWFSVLIPALFFWLGSAPVKAQTSHKLQPGRALTYILEPVPDKAGLHVHIELTCQGDAGGTTQLVLPDHWGGQERLYQAIKNVVVSSPDAKLSDTPDLHVKTVTHRPNQVLHIGYDLVQDFPGSPRNEERYRPILQKSYFHWIGHGAWIYPAWNEEEPVRVSLQWKNLPKGWVLGNSFGANQRRQVFRTTIDELLHGVFTGGDFRMQSVSVSGKQVCMAVRGSWQFSDQAFADLVRKIIGTERAFWPDHRTPYYFVTLLWFEAPPGSLSLGGTGLTNSFALFCSSNAELKDFRGLLAHEYFHNWNSRKLGQLKEPEQLLYWFSEGFTDYYAYLLLLRAGLISLDEYLKQYNTFLKEYYFLPVRTENNQRVLKDFWSDEGVQKLPYRRGFLLATNWNAMIRSASSGKSSLDDVMRDLFRAAQSKKPLVTAEVIGECLSRYAGRDVLPDIRRYVEDGALIAPDKGSLGTYINVETVEIPSFELGLDLETLRTRKMIAAVKPGSAAYRAGLRDGQVIVRRLPIHVGDATKPVEITVKDGDGERTFKYLPEGPTVSVPQYKIRPDLSDAEQAEALRWLGVSAGKGGSGF